MAAVVAALAGLGLGLGLLYFGAEFLVRGSSSLALRLGLSRLFVGLTIVAFGTSMPEMVVSLRASLGGSPGIAMGNVVGSNIFNIAFILGICAVVCPIRIHIQLIRIDAPIMIAVSGLLAWFIRDGIVGRGEGLVLAAGILVYTLFSLYMARVGGKESEAVDLPPEAVSSATRIPVLLGMIAGGLAMLIGGSEALVRSAVVLARMAGVSEAVIGLTVVAAGTSLPELATSVVAATRREPDLSVGNIVGSNIFNILAILGVCGSIAPLAAGGVGPVDIAFMVGTALLLFPFLWTDMELRRWEGLVLLTVYGGYIYYLL